MLPWRATPDGVVLALKVTPNARTETEPRVERLDDGSLVLAMRVRAVPEAGRANEAVVARLAKALGRPRSSISVVSGASTRRKSVAIAGESAELLAALAAALPLPS